METAPSAPDPQLETAITPCDPRPRLALGAMCASGCRSTQGAWRVSAGTSEPRRLSLTQTPRPARECTLATSRASRGDIGGRIEGRHRASDLARLSSPTGRGCGRLPPWLRARAWRLSCPFTRRFGLSPGKRTYRGLRTREDLRAFEMIGELDQRTWRPSGPWQLKSLSGRGLRPGYQQYPSIDPAYRPSGCTSFGGPISEST